MISSFAVGVVIDYVQVFLLLLLFVVNKSHSLIWPCYCFTDKNVSSKKKKKNPKQQTNDQRNDIQR